MKYSQLLGKTAKTIREFDSANATLLQKAGYISQEMAGVYSYLPLGVRVIKKIEQIVREEMNTISNETILPILAPIENWQTTGRLNTFDVLFKAQKAKEEFTEASDHEFILGASHEEIATPLAKRYIISYKDLPLSLYQIQTKFRNEARPKSGLLRGREFRMKDMYSFHISEEDLDTYYYTCIDVYKRVYERLGIGHITYVTRASGGVFTSNFSHEFQTKSETGEDINFHVPSKNITFNKEIAPSKAPELDTKDEKVLPRKDIKGEGIIGVEALAKFLNIPVEKTTKTLIYETDTHGVIAAAVRGDYDVNEEKLQKIIGCNSLTLAREDVVKRVTNAEIGYAGILDLPEEVTVYMDDSMKDRKNFECGANKTNYHSININFGRDIPLPDQFYDVKVAKEGDMYPETGEVYEVFRGSEVGNIFPLGTKYTDAFNLNFTDEHGVQQPIHMGCYGIGTSRVMGIIVEALHDEKGIVWPKQIAPFTCHLLDLSGGDNTTKQRADSVYKQLTQAGIETLYDDRADIRAGEKFTDADLIGIPYRVVVSKKTGEKIELKKRTGADAQIMDIDSFIQQILSSKP